MCGDTPDAWHRHLHHIESHSLNSDTPPTSGMRRLDAIVVNLPSLWGATCQHEQE